jgi:hypothetical protein
VVVAALALGGCRAARGVPAPGPGAPPGAVAAAAPEAPLVDERGRRYVLRAIPRSAGVRVDERTVRTTWAVPLDVVREDDRHYYYRHYERPAASPPAVPPAFAPPAIAPVEPPAGARLAFVPFDRGLPRAGQWRDGFALADVDGDGRLDLVHGPPRKAGGGPVVFLGDGRGSWRRWTAAAFPPLPYEYGDVRAHDLNGDGIPDLALAMHLRGVVALLGDGRGGFTASTRGLDLASDGGAARFSSRALGVADVDGDGRADLVALGDGPRLARDARAASAEATGAAIYLNAGASWRRSPAAAARGLFGNSLAVADFDGDGRPDLAVASGAVGRRDVVQLAAPDGGWRAVELPLPERAVVRAVAAGDVDGDRRAELAVAWAAPAANGWHSGVDLFPGGGAWTRRPLVVLPSVEGASALALGDVDGDGRGDVVALTATGETWVLLAGGGDAAFVREAGPPRYGPGCAGSHVELADLDDDGRAEIVATFAGEASGATPAACPTRGGITAWKAVPRVG